MGPACAGSVASRAKSERCHLSVLSMDGLPESKKQLVVWHIWPHAQTWQHISLCVMLAPLHFYNDGMAGDHH